MKTSRFLPLLLLGHCLFAQHGPARIILFSEPHFRGEQLILEGDTAISDLAKVRDAHGRKWDDRIASVQIEGHAALTIYDDPRYRGERLELRRSVPDFAKLKHGETGLESWDCRISALKASFSPPPPPEPGRMEPQFHSQREADRAIQAAYRELLGREPDYSGLQTYRKRLLDEGWTEEGMRNHLRDSQEYKARDFDQIVKRCYREVLRRDPDPQGLDTYRRALRDRGWSEEQLRTELRRSDELKRSRAREIVDRAYKDILGREPDSEGRSTYEKRIMEGWTENRVREDLRHSQEYRNRKP